MVKTIPMIKSEYLNFLKKQEVAGKPIVDKLGKLNKFYLPLSKWIHSLHKQDNKIKIKQWISDDMVSKVSDYQAEAWTNSDATLWSLVIKPWVLVQPLKVTSFHGENKN